MLFHIKKNQEVWTPDGNNRMEPKKKKVNGKGRLRSTEELITSQESVRRGSTHYVDRKKRYNFSVQRERLEVITIVCVCEGEGERE